ncbi:AsnC family transcriptional regulator [Halobacteriales archaeon QS_1_68_20]|nr:MAG: AsnC family transcriptional regulator [Halobacteriales archaeon QS_1_68_20]
MTHAFVFVDCAAGTARSLVDEIRAVDGVEQAHVVAGDFDVVVELTAVEVRDLLGKVTRQIRSLDGVGTTRTYVALE